MDKISAGIFIFDGVEVLDFAGPFEVLSRTRLQPGVESRRSEESAPFRVFTVAEKSGTVTATGGLRIEPAFDFDSAPTMEILLIPGGFGTRALLGNDQILEWIRTSASRARFVTSVCTGALLLARAGLLKNRRATTHWASLDVLASLDPTLTVERSLRVVDDGVISSAGVSAGVDMAFALVEKICGAEVANETARYIEYERRVGQ